MKKLILALALFSGTALAGSGYIPEWRTHSTVQSCVNVSNISNVDMIVNIQFFTQDGAKYTGKITGTGAINTDYTLPAKNTIALCIPASRSNFVGYGVINGKPISAEDTGAFLLARAVISDVSARNKWQSVTINGGNPF